MRPGLVDAMLLLACPCDTVAWRQGRRAWTRSENPMAWAGKVAPPTRVIAMTGTKDDNTAPALAIAYVDALKSRGVDARFEAVSGETHNGIVRSDAVAAAIRELTLP
jgi:dipeptidyl aminopeptidase/acylaminoacyl peptidase